VHHVDVEQFTSDAGLSEPKSNCVFPEPVANPSPEIVTSVSPLNGPALGEIPVTVSDAALIATDADERFGAVAVNVTDPVSLGVNVRLSGPPSSPGYVLPKCPAGTAIVGFPDCAFPPRVKLQVVN
jgi:hypothetical protein